jgi:hypothetical protein
MTIAVATRVEPGEAVADRERNCEKTMNSVPLRAADKPSGGSVLVGAGTRLPTDLIREGLRER